MTTAYDRAFMAGIESACADMVKAERQIRKLRRSLRYAHLFVGISFSVIAFLLVCLFSSTFKP